MLVDRYQLTQEQIEAFARDGVLLLRGAFTAWVEVLRAGVARNMESPSADVRIYRNADGTGLFFGDYCNWDRIREFRDYVFHSPAGPIAAQLTRSRAMRLFHEHVLVKEPG